MTIFSESGFRASRHSLGNAEGFALGFALEQLVSIQCATTDLRWAMVELAWRSITAMCAHLQARLASWACKAPKPRAEDGRGRPCCC